MPDVAVPISSQRQPQVSSGDVLLVAPEPVKKDLYIKINRRLLPEHLFIHSRALRSNLVQSFQLLESYNVVADKDESEAINVAIHHINMKLTHFDEYIPIGNRDGADFLIYGEIVGTSEECRMVFYPLNIESGVIFGRVFNRVIAPCGLEQVQSTMPLVAYAIADPESRERLPLPFSYDDLKLDPDLQDKEKSSLDMDIVFTATMDGVDSFLSRREARLVSIPEIASDERFYFISAYLSWKRATVELGMTWYLDGSFSYASLCSQTGMLLEKATDQDNYIAAIDSVSVCRDSLPLDFNAPDSFVQSISNRIKVTADPEVVIRYIETIRMIGFDKVDKRTFGVLIDKCDQYNDIRVRKAAIRALAHLYNPKCESLFVSFLKSLFDFSGLETMKLWADVLLFFEDSYGKRLQTLLMPTILKALSEKLAIRSRREFSHSFEEELLIVIQFVGKLGDIAETPDIIQALEDMSFLEGREFSRHREAAERVLRNING